MVESQADAKQKTPRASKPKVRTGCLTCKKRRIKCDERKPTCFRCESFGCDCDGYELSGRHFTIQHHSLVTRPVGRLPSGSSAHSDEVLAQANSSSKHRRLAAKTKQESRSVKRSTSVAISDDEAERRAVVYRRVAARQLHLYPPPTSIFEDEEEARYFQFYCNTTSKQLSGGSRHKDLCWYMNRDAKTQCFDPEIWSLLLLRECHQEPFVRRCLIAISALCKAMDSVSGPWDNGRLLPGIKDKALQNHHHDVALEQYGRAIRRMRDVVADGCRDIRMALISCLLTICFECFHGHHETALTQIFLALQMMQEWQKQHKHTLKHKAGLISPAPHILDDVLYHMLTRLDIAAMHFFDTRPPEYHHAMKLEGAETIRQMPQSFSGMREAGIYFHIVKQRSMHLIRSVKAELANSRYQQELRTKDSDMENKILVQDYRVPAPLLAEINDYVYDIQRWSTSFQPVLLRSRSPAQEQELLPASLLQLHSKMTFVLLDGLRCYTECQFDQYMPEFIEIVSLSQTAVSLSSPPPSVYKPVYVFDPNIVLPLLLVVVKCRDRIVRRKAVALLKANRRREGTWDSNLSAEVGLFIMTREEQGLDDTEYIPEENRLRLVNIVQDFQKRTARISCSQEKRGEMIIHEGVLSW